MTKLLKDRKDKHKKNVDRFYCVLSEIFDMGFFIEKFTWGKNELVKGKKWPEEPDSGRKSIKLHSDLIELKDLILDSLNTVTMSPVDVDAAFRLVFQQKRQQKCEQKRKEK